MSEEKTNPPQSNETFFRSMKQYNNMPAMFKNLLDIQLKNIASINEVNKSSLKNIQNIASKQCNIFSKIMKNTTEMANDLIDSDNSEDTIHKVQEIQQSYQDILSSTGEISKLLRKSSIKTNSILIDNAKQSLDMLQKVQKEESKKAS